MLKIGFMFISIFVIQCTSPQAERTILQVGSINVKQEEFSTRFIDEAKSYNSLKLREAKVLRDIKEKVIDDLIIESLLLNWAKKNGFSVGEQEIAQILNQKIKDYPDELAFRQTYNHLKIQRNIWQKKLKVEAVKKRLIDQFEVEPKIDEKAIKKEYWGNKKSFFRPAEIKLQQIVVKNEVEATTIYNALKKGSDFEKLARKYSIAAEAEEGGLVGWIERDILPVFDAAFKLPKGRISPPKKSSFGFHIFRVLAKKKRRKLPLDEVKKLFSDKSIREQKKKLYQEWLEGQLLGAKILRNEKAIAVAEIEIKGF